MADRQGIGSNTKNLLSKDAENQYEISTIDKSRREPLPADMQNAQILLLKKAVIERHTSIQGRSHDLPAYTLVLDKVIVGDKKNNFFPNDEAFKKIENTINSINKTLDIKLEHNLKNDLHIDGMLAEDQTNKVTYSLSKKDAEKLYSYGLPMITYAASSKNMDITNNRANHSAGKPLGKIREKAINEASSLGRGGIG